MNIRTLFAVSAILLAGLSSGLQAADRMESPTPYGYDTHLDINHVISVDEPKPVHCEVVNAQMTYLDSASEVHTVTYKKMAESCATQN